ncbi:MAG: hypothetical protein ACLP8A_10185 [Methylovirgula sp.]
MDPSIGIASVRLCAAAKQQVGINTEAAKSKAKIFCNYSDLILFSLKLANRRGALLGPRLGQAAHSIIGTLSLLAQNPDQLMIVLPFLLARPPKPAQAASAATAVAHDPSIGP